MCICDWCLPNVNINQNQYKCINVPIFLPVRSHALWRSPFQLESRDPKVYIYVFVHFFVVRRIYRIRSDTVRVCAVNDTWNWTTHTLTHAQTKTVNIHSVATSLCIRPSTPTPTPTPIAIVCIREHTRASDDDCVMLLKSRTYGRLLANGPTKRRNDYHKHIDMCTFCYYYCAYCGGTAYI